MKGHPFPIVLGSYRGSWPLEEFNQINTGGHSTIPDRMTKGGSLSF
jgi:hypothetical protein